MGNCNSQSLAKQLEDKCGGESASGGGGGGSSVGRRAKKKRGRGRATSGSSGSSSNGAESGPTASAKTSAGAGKRAPEHEHEHEHEREAGREIAIEIGTEIAARGEPAGGEQLQSIVNQAGRRPERSSGRGAAQDGPSEQAAKSEGPPDGPARGRAGTGSEAALADRAEPTAEREQVASGASERPEKRPPVTAAKTDSKLARLKGKWRRLWASIWGRARAAGRRLRPAPRLAGSRPGLVGGRGRRPICRGARDGNAWPCSSFVVLLRWRRRPAGGLRSRGDISICPFAGRLFGQPASRPAGASKCRASSARCGSLPGAGVSISPACLRSPNGPHWAP